MPRKVATPLIQGEGKYLECFESILSFVDAVNPSMVNLRNHLEVNFGVKSAETTERSVRFLTELNFLQHQGEERSYTLGPAGIRYQRHPIPDLLFIPFSKCVTDVDKTIRVIACGDGSIDSLEETLAYSRTNCWQRLHWLGTMSVIKLNAGTGELTDTGREMYTAYCEGPTLTQNDDDSKLS